VAKFIKMNKVYYLKTCSTCTRILKELNLPSNFSFQDIKEEPITVKHEAFFSKRAKLYKEMDLKNQNLSERDYKQYILEHYTFLSRPVFIINGNSYIGNSKKNVEAVKLALNEV